MGNCKSQQPSHSTFGLIFGQLFQYKNFTKPTSTQIIQNVESLDLSNKKYLITGASSGIGKEMSRLLIQQGASIVMVSRKMENLDKAETEICENVVLKSGQQIVKQICDLSDLNDVDRLIDNLKSEQFDGIINNGGVLPVTQVIREYNSNQIEETMAVHVVAPYKLVYELRDSLKEQAIVINNTSAGLYSQKLNTNLLSSHFDICVSDNKYKDGALVYAQCKRAMLVMSEFLVDVLRESKVVIVHPGWSQTPGLKPLFEQHPKYQKIKFRKAIDSAYGILTILNNPSLQNGGFYYDGEIQVKHRSLAGTKESQKERDSLKEYIQKYIRI